MGTLELPCWSLWSASGESTVAQRVEKRYGCLERVREGGDSGSGVGRSTAGALFRELIAAMAVVEGEEDKTEQTVVVRRQDLRTPSEVVRRALGFSESTIQSRAMHLVPISRDLWHATIAPCSQRLPCLPHRLSSPNGFQAAGRSQAKGKKPGDGQRIQTSEKTRGRIQLWCSMWRCP